MQMLTAKLPRFFFL